MAEIDRRPLYSGRDALYESLKGIFLHPPTEDRCFTVGGSSPHTKAPQIRRELSSLLLEVCGMKGILGRCESIPLLCTMGDIVLKIESYLIKELNREEVELYMLKIREEVQKNYPFIEKVTYKEQS